MRDHAKYQYFEAKVDMWRVLNFPLLVALLMLFIVPGEWHSSSSFSFSNHQCSSQVPLSLRNLSLSFQMDLICGFSEPSGLSYDIHFTLLWVVDIYELLIPQKNGSFGRRDCVLFIPVFSVAPKTGLSHPLSSKYSCWIRTIKRNIRHSCHHLRYLVCGCGDYTYTWGCNDNRR